MAEIYSVQPESSRYAWNRLEQRPLEGFVYAISPFNFTSISLNLAAAPALMGNVVVWKPSNTQIYSAKVLMDVSSNAELTCRTFGLDASCDFSGRNYDLKDGLYGFDVYFGSEFLASARISLPGKHNVLNALAVVAMAVSAGLEPRRILEHLGEFTGMERRIELKGRFGGIIVLDDYAHHPTEIRASLEAIKQRYAPKRIWCIFKF